MLLSVQSVLYSNDANAIKRAADAMSNAAARAVRAGLIDGWEYRLGDCGPAPTLATAAQQELAAEVERAGGSMHSTYFDANLGSAAGHNRLAAQSGTELLVILNPDVQMEPDALIAMLSALRDGVGMVEARQLPIDHPKDYDASTGETSWASTACALTRRSVFDAVGGFDADAFFLYGDDVDYSWRVRLAGSKVVYEPAARVFHDKRLTPTADWPSSAAERYYSAEASLLIAHKYSMPDRVDRLLEVFRAGDADQIRAAAEYDRRRSDGRLPSPIDAEHVIAQFIGDNYARHRY